ncbi:hypothetical protein BAE44_0003995 [Dichanthelium oligosanthes]|uniref:Uncharacterized protein n=1 Tax=Dichanthelium oligosanthes TaxID=888268 RepID=A0A1E5WC29_9POAL|nr:hypothetical protein BAE44_0003995 [Dichanthelium oligosanthes]
MDDKEKKKWVHPTVAELKQLQQAGVNGVGLCWTFLSRRVQPLKARAYPLFQYSGPTDPTHESEVELPQSERAARVASMLKMGVNVEASLNNHLPPRSFSHNPRNDLYGGRYYPPLLEDKERKKAAKEEATRQAEKKKAQDKRKKAKERQRQALRAAGLDTPSELSEATAQETSGENEGMEVWIDVLLGKCPADAQAGEVNSKRAHTDQGPGASRATKASTVAVT